MGKASKKRDCPVAGHPITPAECGESRGSRFACPADCAFNPFAPANYSQLLQIEQELDTQSLGWLFAETRNRQALERDLRQAGSGKSPHALHALVSWRFLFQMDESSLTAAQRLNRDRALALKNDERVLLQAKMQTRVALLEVRRVLDSEQTEVVDLHAAQPAPIVVRDRSLAGVAGRFVPFLGWLYPLPHFYRLSGTVILLPDLHVFEPKEIVTEIVRHLGGATDEAGIRHWLAENFARFEQALMAVSLERRRLMFESVDAKFGKAVYELRRPFAECREVLDRVAQVAEDELADDERTEGFAEARVWFAGKGDEALVVVADLMRSNLRKIDLPFRYGGEEFTVLLPGTAETEAIRTAERLRAMIEGYDEFVDREGKQRRMTVSIGAAVFPDQARTEEELFSRADAALYVAKRKGKNRVELYEE